MDALAKKTSSPKISGNRTFLFILAVLWAVSIAFASVANAETKTKGDLVKEAKAIITEISAQQVYADFKADKAVVLLDVRTSNEFTNGHLPGAVNVPRGLLEFKIEKMVPDRSTPIVIYCAVGGRGSLATTSLMEMGYTNVKNMEAGYKGWRAEKLPTF